MMRRRSVIGGIMSPAVLSALGCQRQETRTIEEGGVEFRAGPQEQNFVERLGYRFDQGPALSHLNEWAQTQGYVMDRSLYEVGYLGPPPDACNGACEVYMLHVPRTSSRPFVENYMIYVANGQVLRIDNAFQYPPDGG